jgi:hypothetical protein
MHWETVLLELCDTVKMTVFWGIVPYSLIGIKAVSWVLTASIISVVRHPRRLPSSNLLLWEPEISCHTTYDLQFCNCIHMYIKQWNILKLLTFLITRSKENFYLISLNSYFQPFQHIWWKSFIPWYATHSLCYGRSANNVLYITEIQKFFFIMWGYRRNFT